MQVIESNKVYFGDCRTVMRELIDAGVKVQMCITSPPYWGLRDFGCDGQLGLEKTPEEYVAHMVEVFELVRELLTEDGTLWLNIGDSYASGKGTCYNPGGGKDSFGKYKKEGGAHPLDRGNKSTLALSGLKPKDLVGIPWMTAFALRSSGWYLRQDIIWHKPSPMPESINDRCTKAHEYLFLMSKNARYYYDAEAIKEPATGGSHDRGKGKENDWHDRSSWKGSAFDKGRTGKMMVTRGHKVRPSKPKGSFKAKGEPLPGRLPFRAVTETRNKRSVWTVPSKPFSQYAQTSRLVRVERDELCDDNLHIASPSCPLHGGLFALFASVYDDEYANDFENRISHIDNGHVRELSGGYEEIDWMLSYSIGGQSLGLLLREHGRIAILHNIRSRRTGLAQLTSFSYRLSEKTRSRIDGILISLGLSEIYRGMIWSNIWPDDMNAHLRDQIFCGIVNKSFLLSLEPPCNCGIYKEKTEKTSHFAVFPPDLISSCILAGSRPGDMVLDPFFGSGTTGEVCEKLGRRWTGIELNEKDYGELCKQRTAQVGMGI